MLQLALPYICKTMKRKHFIALFCLLVLCIQVLPVRQIGAMLSGSQLTEEVSHSLQTGKDGLGKLDFAKGDPFLLLDTTFGHLFITASEQHIHFAIVLPAYHAGEIPTPPPNSAI